MEEIGAVNEATRRQEENGSRDLVIGIRTLLATLEPPLTVKCRIYRVPNEIRNLNEAAYSPCVVSIGPFYNGDDRLKSMEELKLRYLQSFLDRVHNELEGYVQALKRREDSIRRCYAGTIQHNSDEFVTMILIDSCFILELFLKNYSNHCSPEGRELLKPWLRHDIRRDLILLENQIPFFVLEDLFNIASNSLSNPPPPFIKLALHYFLLNPQQNHNNTPVKHFTDLFRKFSLPPFQQLPTERGHIGDRLPSASELIEAGLKLEVSSKECFFDLQFSKGVLEMPCLQVDDHFESYFRNMMALEQFDYPHESYISDYVLLLDFLINNSKDVDVLVRNGIIESALGDNDEVATMVNKLGKNLTLLDMNSNYSRLCDELNAFYNVPCHKWVAILRHDYFSTPWKIAGSIGAILLLILTAIQTICSVIQVT